MRLSTKLVRQPLIVLLLDLAGAEKEFLGGLLWREAEEGEFGCGAELAIALERGIHKDEVALHLARPDADLDRVIFARSYGFAVLEVERSGHSRGLELACYEPAGSLIDKCRLDTTVQCILPTLIIRSGGPETDNIIAIFVELHLQSVRVVRSTSEAVVALILLSDVWIDNLFHISKIYALKSGNLERIADTEVQSHILPLEVVDPTLTHRIVGVVELETPIQTQNCKLDIESQAESCVES